MGGVITVRRYVVVLLAMWLVLVAAGSQMLATRVNDARDAQEDEFVLRSELTSRLLANHVAQLHVNQRSWAAAILASDAVVPESLRTACTTMGFEACGVFDDQGRLLMNWPHFPELVGRDFAYLEQVGDALRTNASTEGPVNISPALQTPVLALGEPYSTPFGRRIVTGLFTVQGGTLAQALSSAVELRTSEVFVLDGQRSVAARTGRALRAEILSLADEEPSLSTALARHTSGPYDGDRFFASAAVDGTEWTLLATVDKDVLYAPVGSVASAAWSTVLAAGALGLVVLVALSLNFRRRMRLAVDLQRLEVAHAEHDARQRHAREVNDGIVQDLVAAEMAFDLDEPDTARELLGRASRTARRWIGDQIHDNGGIGAGDLVRSRAVAAEMTGYGEEPGTPG